MTINNCHFGATSTLYGIARNIRNKSEYVEFVSMHWWCIFYWHECIGLLQYVMSVYCKSQEPCRIESQVCLIYFRYLSLCFMYVVVYSMWIPICLYSEYMSNKQRSKQPGCFSSWAFHWLRCPRRCFHNIKSVLFWLLHASFRNSTVELCEACIYSDSGNQSFLKRAAANSRRLIARSSVKFSNRCEIW